MLCESSFKLSPKRLQGGQTAPNGHKYQSNVHSIVNLFTASCIEEIEHFEQRPNTDSESTQPQHIMDQLDHNGFHEGGERSGVGRH